MKILQVNNYYPSGSTGKIVNDIHKQLLSDGFESIVCYAIGGKVNENNIYRFSNMFHQKFNSLLSSLTGIMYDGCFYPTSKLIRIIKSNKPDIVHLHCINCHTVNIFRLLNWLKSNKIKTVLTLHAEFMYTANCGYALDCNKWLTGCGNCPRLKRATQSIVIDNTHLSWKKMYKSFKGFDDLIVASVSPWLMERAKNSPILKEFDHTVVLNGLDTNIFKIYNTEKLRKELNLENKKVIFHATAKFSDNKEHTKGGYYVIKLAKMLEKDNVHVLVAGDYAKGIKVPNNVTLLGKVNNQTELAQYYSMADLFLLTSKKETFSMTTAESLCCGTPVVGFKSGAPEQIAIKEYSSFVEPGNIEKLYNEVKKYLNRKKDNNLEKISREKYSKENMFNEYIKTYEKLLIKDKYE